MLAVARTFALLGIEAERVHVELDVAGGGLPSFSIVGLPDAAVRESRERVRSALVNSDFNFPQHRITANLAPADLPKVGPGFDLAIAAALLTASHQLPQRALDRYALAGELALDGSIRPVPGALAMAEGVRGWGMRGIAVPSDDAALAAMADGVEVVPIDHIKRLEDLAGDGVEPASPPDRSGFDPGGNGHPDLSELRGQPGLRYAIEISAAGGHSALLIGPPGAGKTLAARMLPSLLPPLGHAESLEVSRIMSACGERPTAAAATRRPFRAPHHTASGPALVGGGMPPRPGEVTRAHRGVLFLDELGEFRRDALEALRQPLEEGGITVARANRTISLPCRFTLVGASNPCPCGRGANSGDCDCHPTAVARYRAKLSGALADRIDILVFVDRPPADAMSSGPGESSDEVRERVLAARACQEERLGSGRCNAEMTPAEIRRHCRLGAEAERLLADGHERLGLSGRGWDRVVRVARTVADLKGLDEVGEPEIGQALSLRRRTDDDLGA